MRTRTRTLLTVVAALAVALPLAGTVAGGDPGAPPDATPVAEGDRTLTIGTDQVAEGRSVYASACAECHGARLEGFAHFPTLVGATFQNRWHDRTVGELHTYVSELMPLGAGGTLSDAAYAAVVAYLLERNGIEPGDEAFDPSDEAVRELELTFPD